jgi:hypothetical protein
MNIISYDHAKVTVLFPFEEVAPLGATSGIPIVSKIVDRYNFRKGPDINQSQAEIAKNGLKFENATAIIHDINVNIIEFVVFSDGVVITSPTTEQSELFWDDVSSWMITENGFRNFTEIPIRRFVSQLVVEFNKPLERLVGPFEAMSKIISDRLSPIYDQEVPLGFSRLDLEYDKSSFRSSIIVPKFIIERRQGVPFNKERYYCSAPIRTKDHIAILETIERELL